MAELRIGQGVDVHRYRAGRDLVLCGLRITDEIGLDGHSDGDVALHAVADAILGAIARGDLGEHFPSSDPRWRDADSRDLLARVLALASGDGFRIVNCDLTLIGERPLIGPHRQDLRSSLAHILEVDESTVAVKATTTEGLGFSGRGEGLTAMAVVLMERGANND